MVNKSKMMGCRASAELDQAIRDRAEAEGRSVNDVMLELLSNGMNGSLETTKAHVKIKTVDIALKVKELKARIADLEEHDVGGFLGMFQDEDIVACIEALNAEIKELIQTLPKRAKEVDDDEIF